VSALRLALTSARNSKQRALGAEAEAEHNWIEQLAGLKVRAGPERAALASK
jgi:hypothetical protein